MNGQSAVTPRDLFRRLADRFLTPWLDRQEEAAKMRHSEEIRVRAIHARIDLERVSRIYLERLTGNRR